MGPDFPMHFLNEMNPEKHANRVFFTWQSFVFQRSIRSNHLGSTPEPRSIPENPLKPFLFCVRSFLARAWRRGGAWHGVFGQLSHYRRGLSRGLASDHRAPLQTACGGKQSWDPPCWFIRIQSHLAEDWSCHWPFQHWNIEVLFCTFIELHSVPSGQYIRLAQESSRSTTCEICSFRIVVQSRHRDGRSAMFSTEKTFLVCVPPSCVINDFFDLTEITKGHG